MNSDDIKSQPDDGGIFFMFRSLFMICNVDNLINRNIPTLMTFSMWRVCFFIIFLLFCVVRTSTYGGWMREEFLESKTLFLQIFRGNFKSSPSAMENSKTSSALWLWNMECSRMWRSRRQCQTTTIKCVNFSNLLTSLILKNPENHLQQSGKMWRWSKDT